MPVTPFSVNRFQLYATVFNETLQQDVTIELTRVELRYSLSVIPQATLYCAVGREVRTLLAAAIHSTTGDITTLTPVTVWATAREVAGNSDDILPSGLFAVFDGQVVGTGSQRSRNGSTIFVLSCQHFLTGLDFSWTINAATHPRSVGNTHGKAGVELQAGNPNFLVSTLARSLFTPVSVQTDFWHEAMRPWLTAICEQRQIFENDAIEAGNADALAALARFEPFGAPGVYRFGVPMAMEQFDIIGTQPGISSLIADISTRTSCSFEHATIWEKLIAEFGSRYLFAVVPMANRALLAPIIPGLATPGWKTIFAEEYDSGIIRGFLSRPIRGVVLYTGPNSLTGSRGFHRGEGSSMPSVGGHFENPNMRKGMIYFRNAPQWLSDLISRMAFGTSTAAPNSLKTTVFSAPIGVPPAYPTPTALQLSAKTLWDEYAKALYLMLVFQGRRGSIAGKVRFDIAPGSTVDVVIAKEKFVALQSGSLGDQKLTGLVTGLQTVLDSEAAQSYTAIEFSHLHNQVEQNDPYLVTDRHPLWSQPFAGAPLVEELPP